jgi:hypothetical protein
VKERIVKVRMEEGTRERKKTEKDNVLSFLPLFEQAM